MIAGKSSMISVLGSLSLLRWKATSSSRRSRSPLTYLIEIFCSAAITSLSLRGTGMGVKGVAAVADAMSTMASIASLKLDSNGIFGELWGSGNVKEADKFVADCDAFLVALKESKILTLSLQKTGLGPLTLRKLATSLPAAIASLTMSDNRGIGEAGGDLLMDGIRATQNKTIVNIQHDGCNIREEASKFFTHWPKLTSWAPDNTIEDANSNVCCYNLSNKVQFL